MKKPIEHDFCSTLKFLRITKNMTQNDLSKVLGVTRTSISGYERGDRRPEFNMIIKMADFFNVSIDVLFGRKQEGDDLRRIRRETLQLRLKLKRVIEDLENVYALIQGGHIDIHYEELN